LDKGEFILVCSNCGQRLILENGIEYDKITEKFNIVISDTKEILIICNECGNRVRF
jgi:DNA-directed RNA polymerase subunit RPC12/RpoP